MQPAAPSRTALRVAMRRAAHQIFDAPPLVLDDPIALPILGPRLAAELRAEPATDHPFAITMRAFMVARSRYAEDCLARAVHHPTPERRVTQYVLLGAGLDTFAYRNPFPALRVFELDHPATQAGKRERLAAAAIPIPANLTFAPIDFEQEPLAEALTRAGLELDQPTFFSWLGVTPYLSLEAFRATVAFVASMPPGSGLAFDYAVPRHTLSPLEQAALDRLSARVAAAGEPFIRFFTPAELAGELRAFPHREDLSRPEIRARYFDHRPDTLTLHGNAGRLASAFL